MLIEDAERTFWKEKFSGRIVELMCFDYLFDDKDWTDNWEPLCVTYRYVDDNKEDFVGLEMFKLNYKFYKLNLTRLQKVSQG